jgi:hypothetical protein
MGNEARAARPITGEGLRELLGQVLRCIQRATAAARLYDHTHPALRSACAEAAALLGRAPDEPARLVVGLMRNRFVWGGAELAAADDLVFLARLLRQHGMAGLELSRDASADALATLAMDLVGHPGAAAGGADDASPPGGVRLLPVNYGLLRFGDGQAAEKAPAEGPMWLDLRRLAGASDERSAVETAAAVNAAAAAATADDPVDLNALRRELSAVAAGVATAELSRRLQILRWLSRFVARLRPELRRALIAVPASDTSESFGLLETLLLVLPLGEVLNALEFVNHANSAPSAEAMRLYRKLASLARRAPDHRSRIESLLAQAGERDPGLAHLSGTARESVAETLVSRVQSDESAVRPDAHYARQLNVLAGGAAPVRAGVHRELDAAEIRCQAAAVAVLLLEAHAGDSGPAEFLAPRLMDLLRHERIDLVLRALRAAPGATGEAPVAPLARAVGDRRFVPLLLERVCDGRCPTADGVEILKLGGATALSFVLLRLAGDVPRAARESLQQMVLEADQPVILEAVRLLASTGDDRVQSIFALLDTLPPERAVEFLAPLCGHDEPQVRRLAFHALAGSGWVWPPRLMEQALVDPQGAIFDLAAERLSRQPDELSAQLLQRCVGGRLGGRLPGPRRFDRLVLLLRERADGTARLAEALEWLRWPPGRERAARAIRLAWALRRERSEPAVRQAMRRWLRSPTLLLGLLPAGSDATEDSEP